MLNAAQPGAQALCHQPPDIGLRSTKGAVIVHAKPVKLSFHQDLNDQNCMACHRDRAGPQS